VEDPNVINIDGESVVTETEMANGVTLPQENDKTRRKQVHDFIKMHLPDLFSTTEDTIDGKCVRVLTKADLGGGEDAAGQGKGQGKGGRHKRPRQDPRSDWPAEAGSNRYLEFTLYKENRDTTNAVSTLARYLHVSPNVLTFAGTKDRRAVTSQRVSAYRVTALRMQQLMAGRPFGDTLVLGDFRYEAAPLRLGMLSGNQFTITLRDLDDGERTSASPTQRGTASGPDADGNEPTHSSAHANVVEAALRSLHERGFPNYFGLQQRSADT